MSFMVDLRIDIRTKEMFNITPCKKCFLCYIHVSSFFWEGSTVAQW